MRLPAFEFTARNCRDSIHYSPGSSHRDSSVKLILSVSIALLQAKLVEASLRAPRTASFGGVAPASPARGEIRAPPTPASPSRASRSAKAGSSSRHRPSVHHRLHFLCDGLSARFVCRNLCVAARGRQTLRRVHSQCSEFHDSLCFTTGLQPSAIFLSRSQASGAGGCRRHLQPSAPLRGSKAATTTKTCPISALSAVSSMHPHVLRPVFLAWPVGRCCPSGRMHRLGCCRLLWKCSSFSWRP